MTFKKAGLVLVWIDRRILCLHSTARYWANLLYKLPSLTRGKNNTMFHQPQDPLSCRMWDLVTQLVYSKRERASHNHKSMTFYMPRTETTPIFTPRRHPNCHYKEAEQVQPKLNRATSLHPNPSVLLPLGHRTRCQDCYFGTSPWCCELAYIHLYWKRNQSLHGSLMPSRRGSWKMQINTQQ